MVSLVDFYILTVFISLIKKIIKILKVNVVQIMKKKIIIYEINLYVPQFLMLTISFGI
jgi:hypothetical protein